MDPTVDKLIDLWHLGNPCGIIIPASSGIWWSNQVGGIACWHPMMEGWFIPFPESWLNPQKWGCMENYIGMDFDTDKPLPYPTERVSQFIRQTKELSKHLSPISKEEAQALVTAYPGSGMCCEAWIPVKVKAPKTDHPAYPDYLDSVRGRIGFLTYENSD